MIRTETHIDIATRLDDIAVLIGLEQDKAITLHTGDIVERPGLGLSTHSTVLEQTAKRWREGITAIGALEHAMDNGVLRAIDAASQEIALRRKVLEMGAAARERAIAASQIYLAKARAKVPAVLEAFDNLAEEVAARAETRFQTEVPAVLGRAYLREELERRWREVGEILKASVEESDARHLVGDLDRALDEFWAVLKRGDLHLKRIRRIYVGPSDATANWKWLIFEAIGLGLEDISAINLGYTADISAINLGYTADFRSFLRGVFFLWPEQAFFYRYGAQSFAAHREKLEAALDDEISGREKRLQTLRQANRDETNTQETQARLEGIASALRSQWEAMSQRVYGKVLTDAKIQARLEPLLKEKANAWQREKSRSRWAKQSVSRRAQLPNVLSIKHGRKNRMWRY